jgi:hypothetical protein
VAQRETEQPAAACPQLSGGATDGITGIQSGARWPQHITTAANPARDTGTAGSHSARVVTTHQADALANGAPGQAQAIENATAVALRLINLAELCVGCPGGAPLAQWDHSHLTLEERASACDPVAFFDALVEAIHDLERVRDELDAALVSDGGPIRAAKGTATRLAELHSRAITGRSLFPTGCPANGLAGNGAPGTGAG